MNNQFKGRFDHTNPQRIISNSKSQAAQDLFVIAMSNAKQNGTFLEIGGYHPLASSNTYLLEHELEWHGHSIDILDSSKTLGLEQTAWMTFYNNIKADHWPQFPSNLDELPYEIKQECLDIHGYEQWVGPLVGADLGWEKIRPNTQFHQADALNFDYSTIPNTYDYLQIDIDPPIANLRLLEKIIGTVRASIITFEHDAWINTKDSLETQSQSRRLLQQNGYELLINNVCIHPNWFANNGITLPTTDPIVFEDWWVDPDIIPASVRDLYRWVSDSTFLKTPDLILFSN